MKTILISLFATLAAPVFALTNMPTGWYAVQTQTPAGTNILSFGFATNAGAGTASVYCQSNGQWVVFTPGSSGSGAAPKGYISGCWPQYGGTNWVVITNGDGMCSDKYFCVTNPAGISVSNTTWATTNWNGSETWGYQYYYVAYSSLAATPNAPSIYAATNVPAFNSVYNQWCNSATNTDRVLGSMVQSNNAAALLLASTDGDGWVMWKLVGPTTYPGIELDALLKPTGAWQAPTTQSSTYLPVGTRAGRFFGCGYQNVTMVAFGICSLEESLSQNYTPYYGWQSGYGYWTWRHTYEVALGAGRNIAICGEDNDENYLAVSLLGYRMHR